jgi:hypothetical protein
MRLPVNNFGRIILMVFILFCLVIRTAYQGVMFEMITTDMRKESPNMMQELLDSNYTIYLWDAEDTDDNDVLLINYLFHLVTFFFFKYIW